MPKTSRDRSDNKIRTQHLTLRHRNQLTIPMKMARTLQLKEDTPLLAELMDDGIFIRPAKIIPRRDSHEGRALLAQSEVNTRAAGKPRFAKRDRKKLKKAIIDLGSG